jgi:proteasome lid subunit RPN8/RPN11
LDAIHAHGSSRTDVEVCGVLVGRGYRDKIGPWVYVEAAIRGHHAGSQLAQVTFTAETWAYMQGVMDQEYPDQRIIGWYHTHPGFGIFLSPMDLFIHENFFSAPEQVAIVYDPVARKEGLFVWRRGAAVEAPFQVEQDHTAESSPSAIDKQVDRQPISSVATHDQDPHTQTGRSVRQQRWVWISLLLVLLAAIAGVVCLWPRRGSPARLLPRPVNGQIESKSVKDRVPPVLAKPIDQGHAQSPREQNKRAPSK